MGYRYDEIVSVPTIYLYANGNPVGNLDPAGLELQPVNLVGKGDTYLDDSFIPHVQDFISGANDANIPVTVSSAFRSTEQQTGLANDPTATTPAVAGDSLHEAGFAIDINWSQVPVAQRAALLELAAESGLSWGGNLKKPDKVHFYMEPIGKRADWIRAAQKRYKCLKGAHPCDCD